MTVIADHISGSLSELFVFKVLRANEFQKRFAEQVSVPTIVEAPGYRLQIRLELGSGAVLFPPG